MATTLPPERASAAVYQRRDRFVVLSIVPVMPGGPQTNGAYLATLPIDASDEELGRAIRAALCDRRRAEGPPPLWQAGGVRSRRAFMNGTLTCSIDWWQRPGSGWVAQIYAAKAVSCGGFTNEGDDQSLVLGPSASDAEIGSGARSALARGTAWTPRQA